MVDPEMMATRVLSCVDLLQGFRIAMVCLTNKQMSTFRKNHLVTVGELVAAHDTSEPVWPGQHEGVSQLVQHGILKEESTKIENGQT